MQATINVQKLFHGENATPNTKSICCDNLQSMLINIEKSGLLTLSTFERDLILKKLGNPRKRVKNCDRTFGQELSAYLHQICFIKSQTMKASKLLTIENYIEFFHIVWNLANMFEGRGVKTNVKNAFLQDMLDIPVNHFLDIDWNRASKTDYRILFEGSGDLLDLICLFIVYKNSQNEMIFKSLCDTLINRDDAGKAVESFGPNKQTFLEFKAVENTVHLAKLIMQLYHEYQRKQTSYSKTCNPFSWQTQYLSLERKNVMTNQQSLALSFQHESFKRNRLHDLIWIMTCASGISLRFCSFVRLQVVMDVLSFIFK